VRTGPSALGCPRVTWRPQALAPMAWLPGLRSTAPSGDVVRIRCARGDFSNPAFHKLRRPFSAKPGQNAELIEALSDCRGVEPRLDELHEHLAGMLMSGSRCLDHRGIAPVGPDNRNLDEVLVAVAESNLLDHSSDDLFAVEVSRRRRLPEVMVAHRPTAPRRCGGGRGRLPGEHGELADAVARSEEAESASAGGSRWGQSAGV
jgi:hypothetical protein